MPVDTTKLNGKQIKDGTINLIGLYSSLGLGLGDDGKALVYTHLPTPTINYQSIKFTKISGVPGVLTPGLALIVNPAGDGVVTSQIVTSVNGGSGAITLNNADQIAEGVTNKYFNGKTTDQLTEGATNKYFNGKTTSDLTEGTNLYWTNGRFDTRFGTAFSAKNIQDLNNVDITGITDGDILKYNLALTKFDKLTLNSVNVPLNPPINDGLANQTNVQGALLKLFSINLTSEYTLLNSETAVHDDVGIFVIQDGDFPADSFIATIDDSNQLTNITSLIAGSIFNFTNTPANAKVNVFSFDNDPGVPVVWRIKIDNQTANSKTILVRKLL